MSIGARAAVGIAMILGASALQAQDSGGSGPTILAARAAVFVPTTTSHQASVVFTQEQSCGSALKNAALMGLGFSLAAVVLEVTYTLVREPFVRRGHEVSPADPALIAWAGGAGFVLGLLGTELCRQRQR